MKNQNESPKRWEVAEMIRDAIEKHETRKESLFVTKTEFEYATRLSQQSVEDRIRALEVDSRDNKDHNKWLFRLVVGAVVLSLIPIAVALLAQAQGNILSP